MGDVSVRVRWMTVFGVLVVVAFGVTYFAGRALTQESPIASRPTVYTLADSLVGGAAGLSIDRMGVVYAGTFDDQVYRIRMDGRSEIFARGLYGATSGKAKINDSFLSSITGLPPAVYRSYHSPSRTSRTSLNTA